MAERGTRARSFAKAIKAPAVRLVKGGETGQFLRDVEKLEGELEALKRK